MTLTILRDATIAADFPTGINDTVTIGATTVPIAITAAQEATATFQNIQVSNASFNIDNGLIITAKSGTNTPFTGGSSTTLTGITLTVEDPNTPSDVLFTISAGSATYTSFTGDVTPAEATADGLPTLLGGGDWQSGDIDVLLTNVSFSIGSYVSFTAASIEIQHTAAVDGSTLTPAIPGSSVTVDNFIFTTATVSLLNNGQPMVSLTGSPTFDYIEGSTTQADNGFNLVSFTNPGFTFLDPTYTLGPITLRYSSDRSALAISRSPWKRHDRSSRPPSPSSRITATVGNGPLPGIGFLAGLDGTFDTQTRIST